VDGGSRRPVAVAVPLEQVDFALAAGKVIPQPPGRPATASGAVEFDPGFPLVPMPPRQLPMTKPSKYLSPSLMERRTRLDLPSRNTFSRRSLTGVRFDDTTHFAGSGAEPAGPSNSSWNRKPPVWAPGAGAVGGGAGRGGVSGREG
jgi:hypothetical protein